MATGQAVLREWLLDRIPPGLRTAGYEWNRRRLARLSIEGGQRQGSPAVLRERLQRFLNADTGEPRPRLILVVTPDRLADTLDTALSACDARAIVAQSRRHCRDASAASSVRRLTMDLDDLLDALPVLCAESRAGRRCTAVFLGVTTPLCRVIGRLRHRGWHTAWSGPAPAVGDNMTVFASAQCDERVADPIAVLLPAGGA